MSRALKVWLIAPHAPEIGVDHDIAALQALFTRPAEGEPRGALHPTYQALPENVVFVRNGAGTLLEEDLRDAFEGPGGIERWAGRRVVWIGGHCEPRGLGAAFFCTNDSHGRHPHGGYVTVDDIWLRLNGAAGDGGPLLAVFDACHAAPSEALDRDLHDNLAAIAPTRAGQRTVSDPNPPPGQAAGWLTRAFIAALTRPREDHAEVTVSRIIADLNDARNHGEKGGLTPFLHDGTIGGEVFNLTGPPTPAPLAAWMRYTRGAHRNLVPFFRRGSDRLLDEVYVELCLDRDGTEHAIHDDSDAMRDDSGAISRHAASLSLKALMESADGRGRWLVLGEPGAGKTTIARHLAATLATGDGPVPIYLPLARLAGNRWHPFKVAEEILLEEALDEAGEGLVRALQRRAAKARGVWLLLDGLDEIADKHRAALLERITAWADGMRDVAIAVFGRPFRAVDLPGFGRATVRALDAGQQRQLLGGWLNETQTRLAADAIAARPRLSELAQNPLLLSLMALLTRRGEGLPPTRAELYAAAVKLLLAEPQGYGRSCGISNPGAARRLLGGLSVALHHDPAEGWETDRVCANLRALRDDPDLAADLARFGAPDDLLAELAQGGGVFGPFGDTAAGGEWRYLHRSLREFLAAEHIAAKSSRLQAVLGEIGRTRNPDHWGVVLGLACALSPEPKAVLALVREASTALALWALPDVELPPADGLRALETIIGEADPADHGEDYRRLMQGWADLAAGRAAVEARVGPETPVERLAVLHYAMRSAGIGWADAEFFAAAGRPMPAEAELVDILGGDFIMGSPPDEEERFGNELPHPVTVSPFAMGETPVTRAEYARFDPRHRCPGGDKHPVAGVSWYAARLYAAWAGCRLPTEAEWEYACRAGTSTRYWSGDTEADLERVGWYSKNDRGEAQPVGGKPANDFGLRDMHGNVLEWCADWFGPYEPADRVNPLGPPTGVFRVVRGGSAWDSPLDARSACRYWWSPPSRDVDLGFRLARGPRAPGWSV